MVARRIAAVLVVIAAMSALSSQAPARRPLSNADVDDITTLVRLEDTRTLDEAALARLLKSAHPEVRRRAAMAVGRINKPEGGSLLVPARCRRRRRCGRRRGFRDGPVERPRRGVVAGRRVVVDDSARARSSRSGEIARKNQDPRRQSSARDVSVVGGDRSLIGVDCRRGAAV